MSADTREVEAAVDAIRRLQANHLLGAAEEPAAEIVTHLEAILARLAAVDAQRDELARENERLREIIGDAIPALGHHGRDFSQRALIEACKITGGDPRDWSQHPTVLTRLLAGVDG